MQQQTSQQPITTHYRACHLCEAICGLEIKTQGEQVLSIKGDKQDPLSHGYICPKATAIADIHTDPDRLRMPMQRIGEAWHEISWDEAIELAASKLVATQTTHGPNSVGFFGGNPGVHNYGNITHGTLLRRAIKTKNNFSATSLDQLPHHLASLLMYGHQFFLPVPDIDETNLMVIFGGNPMASNGSMMTVPNAPKRFKALQARGGRFIVIDPRRTETAEVADQHHFIKPGTDAYLLMAVIHTLFADGLINMGHLADVVDGLDEIKLVAAQFDAEMAANKTGVDAAAIRALAHDLATTERAVVYGRMGVSVQQYGAICQWAIQVINILIGALDSVGGALLTSPPFAHVHPGAPAKGHFNRFQSRVSGLPEFGGELPAVVMAEEMLTEGEGQIKAMVTIAGNPVNSSTNAGDLAKAFAQLDFYVAVDFYINGTTQYADLILPPTGPLEHDHYDIAFLRLAVRNVTRHNPAVFTPAPQALHDWQIFNALSARICELKNQDFRPLPAPDVVVAHGIANDVFGAAQNPDTPITFEQIKAAPHGLDLGPLQADVVARLCTDNGRINAAPQIYLEDLERLLAPEETPQDDELLLIGRRHIRSNNSWMHNYHRLVKGKPRWQLLMHPDDLAARGLAENDDVQIQSRVGSVQTKVLASDEIMPGVVSLPHGWGHQSKGIKMSIASQQQGVNCNLLTDDKFFDKISGNAALNGVPVKVSAVA